MRLTFRFKLILLAGCAALTIIVLILWSEWIGTRHREELVDLERRLVPRIELALKLEAQFLKLERSFQDAVSAEEKDALIESTKHRDQIFELLENAGLAVEPSAAAALRWKIQDYYDVGQKVSLRLIQGQGGEDAVRMIAELQLRQRSAAQAIQAATNVDRNELQHAFGAVHQSSLRSGRLRMEIGVVGLCALILLWFWSSSQMLRSLASLSDGFSRFALGKFEPIVVSSNDELGDVARGANSMAENLSKLAGQQKRADWIKSGQVELSNELGGNLSLESVATRVAECLAERVDALAAAVYLTQDEKHLYRAGQYAHSEPASTSSQVELRRHVGVAEGLLGQAYLSDELRVLSDLPPNYFEILSGLGRGYASHLALLPLSLDEERIGVVELALSKSPSEMQLEFLRSTTRSLFVAFQAARDRGELNKLLGETQEQAQRLAAQEEELRLSNQELSAQQEELRRANEELEEQKTALSERNRELNLARTRVQEKVEELGRVSLYKSQFLANMSHELRTPLNSMLLLSHLLSRNDDRNLSAKQVEYSETIHSAGEDLLDLINQVLDLSKIEAGKQELLVEEIELSQVAQSMRRVFEPLAREKELEFLVEIDETSPRTIVSDRLRLERVLTNLLGNAIKFTETGRVDLRIASRPGEAAIGESDETGPRVAFVVQDTGIGIAPSEQARAFRPFEQIEASTARRFQGTGLGLAIVRESVALLGGTIGVESELGKGSTFTCLFPYQVPHSDLPEPEKTFVESLERPVLRRDNDEALHVLVIEDDPILAEQLLAIIDGRGLTGLVANSGELGLNLAKSRRPAGIILDVKLPDIDGWTVMERLQSDPNTKAIPVHFLSAMDASDSGLIRGAVGYLTKPASPQSLNELVQRLIPDGPTLGQKILVVEDSNDEGQSILALLRSENYQADHVTSAEDALTTLTREYGCIILDLGLKSMDGLGFLERLRKRSDVGSVSVIVHTGRSLTRKETYRLEAYAQAIVMKDGQSSTRLLEEVRLFVHHVKDKYSVTNSVLKAESTPALTDLKGLRLLLVEDDMRTVYSLSALLQSRGCGVVVAENGREALDLLSTDEKFDCVLMDIMMPQMDGYEAIGHIRANPRLMGLPIIALTAKAMSGERERCLDAGANDYLSKPVDGAKLLQTVDHWAQRSHS